MKKSLFVLGFVVFSGQALAATNASEALAERKNSLSTGYATIGGILSDILKDSAGTMAGSHSFSPPRAFPKFGLNAGVLLGVTTSKVDKANLAKNSTVGDITKLTDSLPDAIPVPQWGFNAHLGLPAFFFDSLDLGLRSSTFRVSTSDGKNDTLIDMQNVGFDVRGNLLEDGLTMPVTLTLGLNVDTFRGNVKFANTQTLNDSGVVSGYNFSGTTVNGFDVDMNDLAVGLKAILSRKFLFFRPYAGVGVQINSGSVTTTGYQTGAVTVTGPGGPLTSNERVEGKGSANVRGLDTRLGAGFELDFTFVYLSLNYDYAMISQGYGATFQIGGKFR